MKMIIAQWLKNVPSIHLISPLRVDSFRSAPKQKALLIRNTRPSLASENEQSNLKNLD